MLTCIGIYFINKKGVKRTKRGTFKWKNITGIIESTEGLEINSVHIRESYEWQLELEKEAQTKSPWNQINNRKSIASMEELEFFRNMVEELLNLKAYIIGTKEIRELASLCVDFLSKD